MSFKDKVVIVTGASSGIGAAIAIKFAEEGARVTLVGRNLEKLNNVAEKCGKPLVVQADVSKDEDAKRLVNETVQKFGQIDVLVNNAGVGDGARITDKNVMKTFDKLLAINLRAPVLITNLAVPYLIQSKGNIINISSTSALRTVSELHFAYNTSKAGLDHFTRSIALELAPKGVRANTVSPGPVRTDIIENLGVPATHVDAIYEKMKEITALDRISEPEEIADVVLFLASDKARGITGSTYVSDNGHTILH